MSYKVLARKWRPQNFKEMIGQEHVLRALTNALDSDRLHHAYLFTGTRGVGKTTIARILAKSFNCETGITSEPCGTCNSCQEITTGNCIDLIEVDAASRTKVEDTRELLENVQYAPTRARFKVYLIDEVHMLTGHSFNALLKTLEEPPAHVKFLFATTDPQKLPATILSRCLQFNLKRMPVDMITGHLDFLLKEESIASEPSALRLIGRAADGSMRDALSLLDQAIAFSGNNISESAVRDMLGTVSHEPLVDLLKSIVAGNGENLLQQVEEIASINADFYAISDGLISLLHHVAVLQAVPSRQEEEDDSAQQLAQEITKEEVQLFYQIALQGRQDLALSPDPRSGFEMLLLRMMSFRPLREGMVLEASKLDSATEEPKKKTIASIENSKIKEDVDKQKGITQASGIKEYISEEIKSSSTIEVTPPDSSKVTQQVITVEKTILKKDAVPPWEDIPNYLNEAPDHYPELTEKSAPPTFLPVSKESAAAKEKPVAVSDNVVEETTPIKETPQSPVINKSIQSTMNRGEPWHIVVPQLQLSGRANELIKHCLLEESANTSSNEQDNNTIFLILAKDREDLLSESTKLEILGALKTYYGDNIRLTIEIENSGLPSVNNQETPAQRSDRKTIEIQQQAEQNIENDPFVLELKSRFGAQIVPGSIKTKVDN